MIRDLVRALLVVVSLAIACGNDSSNPEGGGDDSEAGEGGGHSGNGGSSGGGGSDRGGEAGMDGGAPVDGGEAGFDGDGTTGGAGARATGGASSAGAGSPSGGADDGGDKSGGSGAAGGLAGSNASGAGGLAGGGAGGSVGGAGTGGQSGSGGGAGSGGAVGADYEGLWAGLTEQGKAIEFEILGGGLIGYVFGWQLPICASTTRVSLAAPAPIVEAHARYSFQAPAGMSSVISIDFASESAATGELTYTYRTPGPTSPPMCNGTATVGFSATKIR